MSLEYALRRKRHSHILRAMKQTVRSRFFGELEALRGLACLTVVACHCYMLAMPKWGSGAGAQFAKNVAELFLYGQSVVLLFFVLSGFVLGCLLDRVPIRGLKDYCWYLFRRFCRLVPPSWVSIAFAVAVSGTVFSWREIFEAASLYSFVPNPVLWTMYVEVVASACIPAMYWVARTRGLMANFVLLAALLMATLSEAPSFTQFLVFFHVGLLISHVPSSWSEKISPSAGFSLMCLAFLAMFSFPHLIVDKSKYNFLASWHLWLWSEIVPTFIIVYIVVNKKAGIFQRFLNLKWIQLMGTISLGVYLFHFHLILIIISIVDSHIAFWPNNSGQFVRFLVVFLSTIAASLPLSVLMYLWVERPFIAIGKGNWSSIKRYNRHAT